MELTDAMAAGEELRVTKERLATMTEQMHRACRERDAALAEVERLRAAIASHQQEQGEAVTKNAADAADRRLWRAARP